MSLGRILLAVGLAFVFGGMIMTLADRVPFLSWMGKLPGDLRLGGGRWTFCFPIVTCIVLGVLLTVLFKVGRLLLARLFV